MSVSHLVAIVRVGLIWLNTAPIIVLDLCVACVTATAQTTATSDIDASLTTPVHPGFTGVNDEVGFAIEYWDYRFIALAAKSDYGWPRFPGGNTSDIYNWQTGKVAPGWMYSADASQLILKSGTCHLRVPHGLPAEQHPRIIEAMNLMGTDAASLEGT